MIPFSRGQANPRGAPSPLVEAVTKHKGDWTVNDQDWGGRTNNQDHEMWVPLDDEPCPACGNAHGNMIRGHELMHTKLSPEAYGPIKVQVGDKEVPVSAALVEVAEEYRINYSLSRVEGKTLVDTGWCEPAIEPGVHGVMDQGKFTEVIKLAVAGGPGADNWVNSHLKTYIKSVEDTLREKTISDGVKDQLAKKVKVARALLKAIPAYSAAAARIMRTRGHSLPSWSQTERLAAFLEVNLKEFNRQLREMLTETPPDLDKMEEFLRKHGRIPDPKDPESGLDPSKKVEKHGEKLVMGETAEGGPKDVLWGEPDRITEADMPLTIAPWKLQRFNRAVEEGTIPRYMHRWPSDKRVFSRTKRKSGGTLLVDDSASMGLTPEDLNRILEALPLATVAVYAGRDQEDGGEIRVVARDGKRAREEDLSIRDYGGNGIDGPALEWLGEQSYPRIWITDGGVTDITFGFGWQVVEAAKELVVKHRVTVAEDAEQAAEILKTGRYAR